MNIEEFLIVEWVRDNAPLFVRHEEFCGCADGCEDMLRSHPLRECNLWDRACYDLVLAVARQAGANV